MTVTALKPKKAEPPKTHVWRTGIGGFMRMTQSATATCRRLSATDPGLVMVVTGRKIIRDGQSEISIKAGSAVVLPTGHEFDVTNEVGANGLYQAQVVYFDQATLPTTAIPKTKAVETVTDLGRTSAELARAMDAAVAAIENESLPLEIAAHRLGEVLLWVQAAGFTLVRPRTQNLLNQVRRILGTDPSAKWSTAELANELAVSEATLRRRLAKAGTTLTDIAIDVRMTTALAMLQTSEENITGIAMAVGYDSPSRFALRFRDRFGVSPSDFRRS
jgi:AraC-like DNA-binding protein